MKNSADEFPSELSSLNQEEYENLVDNVLCSEIEKITQIEMLQQSYIELKEEVKNWLNDPNMGLKAYADQFDLFFDALADDAPILIKGQCNLETVKENGGW